MSLDEEYLADVQAERDALRVELDQVKADYSILLKQRRDERARCDKAQAKSADEVIYRIEAETQAAKERDQARREWDEAHAFIAKQTKEIEALKGSTSVKWQIEAINAFDTIDELKERMTTLRALLVEVKDWLEHASVCQQHLIARIDAALLP